MRVSNKQARNLVVSRRDFTGSNIFGETNSRGVYAVYSYGYHFPLFAFIDEKWYENEDRYSVTTSKHKNQVRPYYADTIKVSTNELKAMI